MAALVLSALVFSTNAQAAPPVLTVPGSQTVNETEVLTFNVSAVDPDGQTVVLTASSLPLGSTFTDHHNNTGTFTWTPDLDQSGSYSVSFRANDTFGGIDNKSVSITVMNVNSAPVLSPIGDRTVERGTVLYVSLSGWDAEGDPLTFRATNLPAFGSLFDAGDGNGYITFSPDAGTPTGSTAVTAYLSDGVNEVSETFSVTVTAAAGSNAPVLDPIGNQTVTEGTTAYAALSASDADGDVLGWSVALPGFANLVVTTTSPGSSTARLELRPGYCDAGSYPASISVTDGSLLDSESLTILVSDANRLPAWQAPGGGYAMTLDAGATASLEIAAVDPDETCGAAPPSLSIAETNGGTALTLSLNDRGNGSGTLQVVAASDGAGSYGITIRATDSGDASAHVDASVAVTVNAVAGLPPAARAWSESDPIRLKTGKPRERFYLEPVAQSFDLGSVLLPSIRLHAWPGAGSVDAIAPLPNYFVLGLDRDQNGVLELRMEFTKEDLRALFGNLSDPSQTPLTLTADLAGGGSVTATLGLSVLPEQRPLRRVGPNPMNPEAVVTVHVEEEGQLRVSVYDLRGRRVRTILDESNVAVGDHMVRFDGRDDSGRRLASGRYFVQAETATAKDSAPITILK